MVMVPVVTLVPTRIRNAIRPRSLNRWRFLMATLIPECLGCVQKEHQTWLLLTSSR